MQQEAFALSFIETEWKLPERARKPSTLGNIWRWWISQKSDPGKPDLHQVRCCSPSLAQPTAFPAFLSLLQKTPRARCLLQNSLSCSCVVCISKYIPWRDRRGSILITPYSSQTKDMGNRQLATQRSISLCTLCLWQTKTLFQTAQHHVLRIIQRKRQKMCAFQHLITSGWTILG